MSGPAMAALATRCLDFCQHLEAQGKAFKFSLSLGNDFTFTLDTREEATTSKVVRKKLSPSSLKRNARRKLEFQNRKANTSEKNSTTPEKESTTSENKAASSETKSTTSEEKSGTPEKNVKAKEAKKEESVQPWRRPSSCRRCGLPTKNHPGPYGEGRCTVNRRPWYEMIDESFDQIEAEKAKKSQT